MSCTLSWGCGVGGPEYCVEAAGVRVAVTDTKNNISWRNTTVADRLRANRTFSTNSRFFLWGILREVDTFVSKDLKGRVPPHPALSFQERTSGYSL